MDKQYIEQFDIQQKYLNNELAPDERIQFEEYILDKPELIEQLELDRIVMMAMPDLDKLKEEPGLWSGWKVGYSHGVAIAASVALVAVLVLKPTEYTQPNVDSPDIVYLETYRSQEVTTTIEFGHDDRSKLLVMPVAFDNGRSFSLSFAPENSHEFGITRKNMKANESEDLVFNLHKNVLKPGMYRVSIQGESKEVISHFLIEILHRE